MACKLRRSVSNGCSVGRKIDCLEDVADLFASDEVSNKRLLVNSYILNARLTTTCGMIFSITFRVFIILIRSTFE